MRLLVSVRAVEEVEAALGGGADLIDVKEPERGSLGRADVDTIQKVLKQVAGRKKVSAALGEMIEASLDFPVTGLHYIKWGMAYLAHKKWERLLKAAASRLHQAHPGCNPVVVAYADWQRARGPSPQDLCFFACENSWKVVLFDTWLKDGSTLLDWIPLNALESLCQKCSQAGVRVALAGNLGLLHLALLKRLSAEWLAVRSAVCRHGLRSGSIDQEAVAVLSSMLKWAQPF